VKVLVIGGTRFFGYFAVCALAEAGHAVTVFTRGRQRVELPPGVRHWRGDRDDASELARVAASDDWDAVWDNISYTAAHAEAAVRAFAGRCRIFLHTSTLAVYTVCEGLYAPYREEDVDRGREMHERRGTYPYDYGLDRRAGERVLWEAHARSGFPVAVLRLPVVVGPRDYSLRAWAYWRRLLEGGPLLLPDGGAEMHRPVYSGDVVRAVVGILESGSAHAGAAFNLAQREIVSLADFVHASARVLGVAPEIVSVPRDVLAAAGLPPDEISPFSVWRNALHDIERAQSRLGFRPTPFEDWLPVAIEWHRRERAGAEPPGWAHRPRELAFAERWRARVREF
jgi:nucleoside-diphosphate-sugar epimerase